MTYIIHSGRICGHEGGQLVNVRMTVVGCVALLLLTHTRSSELVNHKWSKLEVAVLQKEVHTRTCMGGGGGHEHLHTCAWAYILKCRNK